MAYMTLIKSTKPATLGKRYTRDAEGNIRKNVVANIAEGVMQAFFIPTPEQLAELLKHVTETSDIALMPGRITGAEEGEEINLVPKEKLARALGCSKDEVPGGVQIINGEKYAARVKRGIETSSWLLIDADNPEGMPAEWAALSLDERLKALEQVLPRISTCTRVEYRSSSSRVVKDGEEPGGPTHAWIQISDPAKLDVLRADMRVQTGLQGLSFATPIRSRQTTKVTAYSARTMIDWAVWRAGGLAFCSKPEVEIEGYYVAEAGVRIVNPDGGVLDVSAIGVPDGADLAALRERTGEALSYSQSGTNLLCRDDASLRWNTPIEVKGVLRTLRERVPEIPPGGKLRCEAPFRASQSEAAFIRVMDDGRPMLYDSGTDTAYFLSMHELMFGGGTDAGAGAGAGTTALALCAPQTQAALVNWGEPGSIVSSLYPAPRLDFEMLPRAFVDFVQDTSERMGVPPDNIAIPLMLSAAAALGSGWVVCPKAVDKSWRETPVLWGGLIAKPGSKKSECLKLAAQPLHWIEAAQAVVYKQAHAAWAIAKGKVKDDPIAKMTLIEPKLERAVVMDATYQAVADVAAASPRGLMALWDEITGPMGAWNVRGQEAARAFYLSAWGGNQPYKIDRKEAGTTCIPRLSIVISGGAQPSVVGAMVRNARQNNDGLIQRFQLLICPDASHAPEEVDRQADELAKNRALGAIESLRSLTPKSAGVEPNGDTGGGVLNFAPDESQEAFTRLRKRIEATAVSGRCDHLLSSHYLKMPGAIAKIAMLIHLLDGGKGDISREATARAVRWAKYMQAHAKRLYSLSELADESGATRILEGIKAGDLEDGFTGRDVFRKGWSALSRPEDVDAALDALVKAGWVRPQPALAGGGGGRPTTRYVAHPRARG